MSSDLCVLCQPSFRILSKEAKEEIHLAACEVLRRTGVLIHDAETIEMMAAAGCFVRNGNLVYIPTWLVEESVRLAPRSIHIANRRGEIAMRLEGRKSYWGTGSDTPFILDSRSSSRRKTNLDDIAQVSVLVDALEHLDFHMCMGVAHELPQSMADKHHFLAMVSNTIKPLVFTASSVRNLEDIYRMACLIAGGEEKLKENPFIIHYAEPIAPLIHPRESLQKLLFCVDHRIPVVYTSGTTTMQNGPATLAGSLVLSVARGLSGIVIAQLRRKGAEIILTFHASSMDPRSSIHTYASPEHILCQAAGRDMAELYGIPHWGRAGCSDAKVVDQQAAFEAGVEIMMQAVGGENLIHDVGYIESGLTSSWDSIVICNELIGMAKRVLKGFEISPETLALDIIHQVGPSGHFLMEDHTFSHYREETFLPRLIDRELFDRWKQLGGTTLLDRARQSVFEILESHRPEPLDEKILAHLKELADKKHRIQ
ncbi:MAG: trimethylamine methyltransferase family protein [Deltaproteobacteria bacterium]|nr:trimethylamine methyltransferase family protein [Deltaproteobacteria bacterium]